MTKNTLWQLGAFVAILVILNSLFGLNISIFGSILLTLAMTLAFNAIWRR